MRVIIIINTNLYPISHRFQVIADYWSIFAFDRGYLSLTRLFGVNPWI